MSDIETDDSKLGLAEPKEAAPSAVSAERKSVCTNLVQTQAETSAAMETLPRDNQEPPVMTSSPTADSGFAEATQTGGRTQDMS